MFTSLYLRSIITATTKIAPSIWAAPVNIFLTYCDDLDNQYANNVDTQFHTQYGQHYCNTTFTFFSTIINIRIGTKKSITNTDKHLVIAAVNVVFPWSTWPIVPILQCGFVRSNLIIFLANIIYINHLIIFIFIKTTRALNNRE